MRKKFSVIFILTAFLLIFGLTVFVGANPLKNSKAELFAKTESSVEIKSKSAYLIEPTTGTVIMTQNETERLPIASMCKIMTLLLCYEDIDAGNIDFDTEITVSENASSMGGSQIFLETNGVYKVGELIKGITVASANDACVAMAEKICGSEDLFVDKMNDKALELGMNNTNFANCTGLPKAGQYSCAEDVAKMFSELIKHKDYFKYSRIWMDEISHPGGRVTEISNTNKLIRFYEGCDGGKTGYTSEAGHCLCATSIRNGMRLVSVVISSPDSKTRFKEVSSMFNYGFANFANKMVVNDSEPLSIKVDVLNGKKDSISVRAEKPVFIFSKKNEQRSVEINFEPIERVKAPINKGDVVGKLNVYENGVSIASVNVISEENVESMTYFDHLQDIANNWGLIN